MQRLGEHWRGSQAVASSSVRDRHMRFTCMMRKLGFCHIPYFFSDVHNTKYMGPSNYNSIFLKFSGPLPQDRTQDLHRSRQNHSCVISEQFSCVDIPLDRTSLALPPHSQKNKTNVEGFKELRGTRYQSTLSKRNSRTKSGYLAILGSKGCGVQVRAHWDIF